jgi:hypothetical protein
VCLTSICSSTPHSWLCYVECNDSEEEEEGGGGGGGEEEEEEETTTEPG